MRFHLPPHPHAAEHRAGRVHERIHRMHAAMQPVFRAGDDPRTVGARQAVDVACLNLLSRACDAAIGEEVPGEDDFFLRHLPLLPPSPGGRGCCTAAGGGRRSSGSADASSCHLLLLPPPPQAHDGCSGWSRFDAAGEACVTSPRTRTRTRTRRHRLPYPFPNPSPSPRSPPRARARRSVKPYPRLLNCANRFRLFPFRSRILVLLHPNSQNNQKPASRLIFASSAFRLSNTGAISANCGACTQPTRITSHRW